MEVGGESDDDNDRPALEEFSRRLSCPLSQLREVQPENGEARGTPSNMPWRLLTTSFTPKSSTDDATSSSALQFQPRTTKRTGLAAQDVEPSCFVSDSYLELRRRQNSAWATEKLKEGNQIFFADPTKAETCYLQGLDMCPDHTELLLAHGNLLLQTQRRSKARRQFEHVLDLDPSHVAAKAQLKRLDPRGNGIQNATPATTTMPLSKSNKKASAPVARENAAYQDALLERNLAMEQQDPNPLAQDKEKKTGNKKSSKKKLSSKHKKSSKKKKKKRRRKERRKKYRRRNSDHSLSESSSTNSSSQEDPPRSTASSSLESDFDDSRKRRRPRARRRLHDSSGDDSTSSNLSMVIEDTKKRPRNKRGTTSRCDRQDGSSLVSPSNGDSSSHHREEKRRRNDSDSRKPRRARTDD